MERQLAPEVWALVMQHLPPSDRRTCLSISSTHHTVAKRLVFSDITITLGLWKDVDIEGDTYPLNKTIQDEVGRDARRSLNLLRHILATPEFADVVRKVTVRAQGLGTNVEIAFDIGILARALNKMRNLRALTWYGTNPAPSRGIFDALIEASGKTLVHLSLPMDFPKGLRLTSHTQLTSFAVLQRNSSNSGAEPPIETAKRIIMATAVTLRRLCVSSSSQNVAVLYGCDPQAFVHLQELSLIFPRTISGLDALFLHLTRLQSLTFCVDADLGIDEAVTEALRTHPDAFPALHSFKLLHNSGFPRGTNPAQDVADFISGRGATLRRLDVVLGASALAFYGGCPLMWSLPKLPALEVLGFDFYPAYLVRGLVEFLDINLPRGLTALHVYARVGQADMAMEDWMDFFGTRGALRFVNVVCELGVEIGLWDVLSQHPPRLLELLGFNFGVHTVERDVETGDPVFSERWSWPKAFYAAVEHEEEEDWEWLLRHHGHNDRIDIAEWMLKASDEGLDPHGAGGAGPESASSNVVDDGEDDYEGGSYEDSMEVEG
ncbi:hypothetical protein DICSQDRAFT_138929 [Dichomitus squalens LYAD-421 SS1]|uniref:F-box domain-containing protein n=1 Tax=Dichomitus squalens (strain LYAD-421) TaxID=732165 RepID=R7SRR1_DICSQ|nr:uncharacterized protein DICSQDRAFT_138929 [Dichomitus squalens LYAD-421 SS1]EJF58874.1 hypothetical protein DICSQDRAFT_138929 [Dichomitus squalens LYAD-421 SS1]